MCWSAELLTIVSGKSFFHPDVVGEILRSKVIRAVGSVLGLKENLAGSAAYTAEQVKSVAWLKQHGYTGSIMDNNPYNYAVQKSDKDGGKGAYASDR